MEIEKPIFIVGSGRSGTTVLYNILSLHKEVCWFSNFTDRNPEKSWLPVLNRAVQWPIIGNQVKHRITHKITPSIRPSEGEVVYRNCGFVDDRKMEANELTSEMASCFKTHVADHVRLTGKSRFISKRTANNQRIQLIAKMFPDAYFVHIIRDGRAVANSLFRVPWWREIDIWWLEGKADKWDEMGREPIELCAQQWKRDVEEILNNRHLFGDRYLELNYEQLVTDAPATLKRIMQFCELSVYPDFFDYLPNNLKNMNYKWDKNLSAQQKQVVETSIGNFLVELGYEL